MSYIASDGTKCHNLVTLREYERHLSYTQVPIPEYKHELYVGIPPHYTTGHVIRAVQEWADQHNIRGFSILKADGRWCGTDENALILIFCSPLKHDEQIIRFAARIKAELEQEEVMHLITPVTSIHTTLQKGTR